MVLRFLNEKQNKIIKFEFANSLEKLHLIMKHYNVEIIVHKTWCEPALVPVRENKQTYAMRQRRFIAKETIPKNLLIFYSEYNQIVMGFKNGKSPTYVEYR